MITNRGAEGAFSSSQSSMQVVVGLQWARLAQALACHHRPPVGWIQRRKVLKLKDEKPGLQQVVGLSVIKSCFLFLTILLNRIQTMNGVPLDRDDHQPLGSAADQWLGLHMGDQDWALPVLSVAAVFRPTPEYSEPRPAQVIDVVVYGGAPVFIAQLARLFDGFSPALRQTESSGPWVVVLADASGTPLGFRVDEVIGPFHAPIRDGRVFNGEKWWQVLHRTGVAHA